MSRVISTTLTTGITLVSGNDPVSITSTGRITDSSGNAIYGGALAAGWTISNSGTIVEGFSGTGFGVYLESGGPLDAFTNQSGGLITSVHNGVGIKDAGVVINQANATITSTDAGLASAVYIEGSGTIVNAGLLKAANTAIYEPGGGSVTNLATGTISGISGVYLGAPGTVTNAGTIIGSNSQYGAVLFNSNATASRLIVDPGAVFTGDIISRAGSSNVIELASGSGAGTLSGFNGSGITNFATLQFDTGADWTVTGNSGATGLGSIAITGFTIGDTIDLTGFVAVSKTFASNVLTLTNASNAHATLHIQGSLTSGNFSLASDGSGGTDIAGIACYRRGTLILTPSGERPVEELAIDDLLVTLSGEARPLKWIGRRSYTGRFIAGNDDALPIRFAANSLADGIPSCDLDVSPKHAMFVDEVLVPAEMLVNGTTIYQLEDVDSVEYFHLELASHDVIFAEGAASETFVDCDSRGMFHNVAEYGRLYPDDPGPSWQFCAPRIEPASPALVAIRTRLLARAGASESFGLPEELLGNIETCDRIRVKGWAFDLGQPAQRVRLEVICDGEVIGHVVADGFRLDLKEAGYLGDGHCSFNVTHPLQLNPLTSHVIELRRAVDGAAMPGSPIHLPAASRFDAECHAGLNQMLLDAAQTAAKPSELDAVIVQQMAQIEALLVARARLDAGPRADVTDLHSRWGGMVPTASVRRSAPELRPQALFIDDVFPASEQSGGAGAALDHMRALLRIGFDVSFAASQDLEGGPEKATALAALGIRPLSAPWYGSVEEMLRRHAGRFDVVYLHRLGNAASYGSLVRQHCPRAQLIYGVADLHHVRLARQGAVEDRPELGRLAARQRMEELMAAHLADVVVTHSNAEAALLRAQLPGVTVALVPWSVPVHQSSTPFAERDGIVFVGHFGHEPNVDAVHWLAREIVPLVQRQDPAIGFRIVGNAMPVSLRLLAQPGFDLVGSVDKLAPVLDAARLTVAPLRYGAGIKSKVIESLAAGVPCIGTTIAFEGMALTPALGDCVADTPQAFAAALIRLYRDERAHAAVTEAGQRFALVNYGEGRIDALMHQALAPALRRWAGIAEEAAGAVPVMPMAG